MDSSVNTFIRERTTAGKTFEEGAFDRDSVLCRDDKRRYHNQHVTSRTPATRLDTDAACPRTPTALLSPPADTMLTKIKKVKQKAKQKAHQLANQVFGSSSERVAGLSASASINNSGINTPLPTAALLESPPNPNALSSSQTSHQATTIFTIQPVVPIPTQPSPDKRPPPTTQTSNPHSAQESTHLQAVSSASIASPSAERNNKEAAWSGLKTLLGLLDGGAEAFEPLKSAVGGILKCIDIYERAAKGREDYQRLEAELESLFWELFVYLKGPTPPTMTSSLVSLAKGIEKEIGFVLGKEKRNRIERGAEAMEDANEVLECYQRVQRLLERFSNVEGRG
ncbi:hypothetical protein BDV93DRAFT_516899 [Ceratobasidium sp. AG-I]|nr:hypothetical protein BDV93DRAFT_516899 [Ceratobasidium sp. AG-I]